MFSLPFSGSLIATKIALRLNFGILSDFAEVIPDTLFSSKKHLFFVCQISASKNRAV
jgi:hypothetical protein